MGSKLEVSTNETIQERRILLQFLPFFPTLTPDCECQPQAEPCSGVAHAAPYSTVPEQYLPKDHPIAFHSEYLHLLQPAIKTKQNETPNQTTAEPIQPIKPKQSPPRNARKKGKKKTPNKKAPNN